MRGNTRLVSPLAKTLISLSRNKTLGQVTTRVQVDSGKLGRDHRCRSELRTWNLSQCAPQKYTGCLTWLAYSTHVRVKFIKFNEKYPVLFCKCVTWIFEILIIENWGANECALCGGTSSLLSLFRIESHLRYLNWQFLGNGRRYVMPDSASVYYNLA